MKKIFGLILVSLIVLTGCSSSVKMQETSFIEAKPLFREMVEAIEKEVTEKVYYDHLYYEEEKLFTSINKQTYEKDIIYTQLDFPYIHRQTTREYKDSEDIITNLWDIFVKDEQLHYFSTTTMNKRVISSTYFICPLDYVYSIDSFGEVYEKILYDEFMSEIQENLKIELYQYELNQINYSIQNQYGIMHNHQKGIKVFQNEKENLTTLKLSYYTDDESEKYNLCIDSSISFKGHLMSQRKVTYYNKEYTNKSFNYETKLELPSFNLEEYESVKPHLLISFGFNYL